MPVLSLGSRVLPPAPCTTLSITDPTIDTDTDTPIAMVFSKFRSTDRAADRADRVDPDTKDAALIRDNEPGSGSGSDDSDFKAIDPHSGVKRGLKTRHLSMMALAGIIGPGLLVGSGGALQAGGPAALIIGFGVIGILAFSIMQSLGELTTLYPSGGAFTDLSDRFFDKAFGVAVGWNYFIIWFAVLANEYNVISSVMVFWSDKVPLYGYFLLFWVSSWVPNPTLKTALTLALQFAFLGFQLLGVETFGEAEFWLALIKLVGLCAFFLFSLVYVATPPQSQTKSPLADRSS